jgi:3-methyladenine DNA glycosylase AlkD
LTATSDDVIAALVERFEAVRDAERAAAMAAYMRDQFAFIGIASPARVALTREVDDAIGPLDEHDLIDLARRAWTLDEREYQYAACWFAARHRKVLTPDFLPTAEVLVSTRPWWDTVDELAKHVVGPIVHAAPGTRTWMDRWLVGDDIWLARTAILHQERWKADTDAEWLFAACLTRAADTEFFIRKAIGWALRSYSYVDPGAVERFVEQHHDDLSGLSRREALRAIERSRRP